MKYGAGYPGVPNWNEIPFFNGQVKIVLRNCGLINPDDIEEYIAIGGYQALYKVLIDQNPAAVIEQVKAAKLRGRAMSISASFVWVACLIVAQTFPVLLKLIGPARTFWIYAACSGLTFLFVLFRFPETKGRTLEEIELSWKKK